MDRALHVRVSLVTQRLVLGLPLARVWAVSPSNSACIGGRRVCVCVRPLLVFIRVTAAKVCVSLCVSMREGICPRPGPSQSPVGVEVRRLVEVHVWVGVRPAVGNVHVWGGHFAEHKLRKLDAFLCRPPSGRDCVWVFAWREGGRGKKGQVEREREG